MAGRRGFTRRDALKMGGAGALAMGLGSCGAEELEEDYRRDPDAPNVLMILTDSTRADYIRAYNPDSIAPTPNIDALARQSLRANLAVPEGMPTGPCRRCVLTGQRGFPFRDWVMSPPLPAEPGWTPIGDYQPMFPELLGRAGIETAYCTDNPFIIGPRYAQFRRAIDLAHPDYSQGAYRAFNKPFTRPAARSEVERYLPQALSDTVEVQRIRDHVGWNALYRRRDRDYSSARVMRAGMQVLDEFKDLDRPFFLACDAFDPHEPFDPPLDVRTRLFGDQKRRIEESGILPIQPFETPSNRPSTVGLDEDTIELVRELYAGEINYTDAWIGRLLNKLDDLGLADNTLVYYFSDHGIMLGEHNLVGKAAARPYKEIYHVPYMIRDPQGRRAGDTTDYFCSTHDVARTILSTMGVRPAGAMDGEDLTVLFDSKEPPARDIFTACYADNVIAGDGRYFLMSNIIGGEGRRLFDTQTDPEENVDIAAQNPEKVEELWTALINEAGGSLPMFGKEYVLGG